MNTSKKLTTLHTRFDKRFGPEYFKRVPQQPGVFWMNDSRRRLLLLGHSKNLKYKLLLLRSYLLHSSPQTESEIINQIHEIHWTHCETIEASQQLVNQLSEKFQSAYHIENMDFDSFFYIHFHSQKNILQLSVDKNPKGKGSTMAFGAFRGKHNTMAVYSALLRWLRFYYYGGSVMQWPSPFNKEYMPQNWTLKRELETSSDPINMDRQIEDFFSGRSRQLLLTFTEKLEIDRDHLDKFTRLWLHRDLSRLDRFFRQSITRNKNVMHCLGVDSLSIEPEWACPLRIRPTK